MTKKKGSKHSDKKDKRNGQPKKKENISNSIKLKLFLNEYEVVGKNKEFTHTSMSDPKGKYNIPEDQYFTFLDLYTRALADGEKLYLTEKHKQQGPIIIDFDFVQDKTDADRHYTEKTIKKCVILYNKIIRQYLDVDVNNIKCFVTEKSKPVMRNGEYHDGIHLIYPYICTKPDTQFAMRSAFIKEAEKIKLFDKLPLKHKSIEKIFDKNVIFSTGWLLYGSRKGPDVFPYEMSKIYMISGDEVVNSYFKGKNERADLKYFVSVMAIRRFFSKKDCADFNEGMDPVEIHNEINKIKKSLEEDGMNQGEVLKLMGDDIGAIKITGDDEISDARFLISLLSHERADDRKLWNRLGMCLHNIDYRLLDDWIKFSKLCPEKFKPGECGKMWKKYKQFGYTLSTLNFWARTDSPEKYLKFHDEKMDAVIKTTNDSSHYSIARIMYEKYRHEFRCASLKGNIWYEFKNHRWIEVEKGYTLMKKIPVEIKKEFKKLVIQAYVKMTNTDNEDECAAMKKRGDELQKLLVKFGDNGFQNHVMSQCERLFYDPEFMKLLDENGKLVGFNNGIYDLETLTFREGCPDDYVSKYVDYDFPLLEDDDESVKEVIAFIKKIFPVKKIRKYFMILLSTCLEGTIKEENIYVMTGSGSNGKSKLMELLKHTLQLYFKPMDIRILTEKRGGSSGASPELADKKGVRCCPLDEPKATDQINTSFMKILTGGDEVTARALYREPVYFKPQCKLFLICNELPEINADDEGTWRRIKTIRFTAKFLKSSDMNPKLVRQYLKEGLPENHHWADKELSEKIPEWKEAFMFILIKHYKIYKTEGLKHPKEVREATDEYRKKCDVFQDFIGDYLRRSDSRNKALPILTLFTCMKRWYRAHHTDNRCPNFNAMKEYFKRRVDGFEAKENILYGWELKVDNDDVDKGLDSIGEKSKEGNEKD